ncbi:hydroxylamine reductase [Mycoplasma sp. P36-A1]|uniref:hydroxylamine reductase n=1 Tax=Mycoplasma sp. P36-A1 TaxID=3252900 RepID=UPI003C2EC7C8
MEPKMYCYQCQETAKNEACTIAGVCGKKPTLANNMDVLKNAIKEISKVVLEQGYKDQEAKEFVTHSLFKCITNANFDEAVFTNEIAKANEIYERLTGKKDAFVLTEDSWKTIGTQNEENADLRGLKEFVITGLMGMAAYHQHAINLGFDDDSIHNFTVEMLAKLKDTKDMNELITMVDRTGEYGVKAMALLDKAHNESLGSPEITEVKIDAGTRPGILISGHDMDDMEQLLEQSKDAGIDIYTHSEMLPAHYYPKFKKYDHLYGNYGNAWWKQVEEFKTFNGPILFTTNCIVPFKETEEYGKRIYTTNDAGYPGCIHIKADKDGKKDFSEIIEQAKQCQPPQAIEQGTIVGGFAHNQVVNLIDSVVENVKNGSIRKFFVMSGCDGRFPSRKYYTEFAEGLKDDTVILTSGCAKYRYNKLNLGDINGIPRVLDAGQCNDSYTWAVVAMKLKEIFEADTFEDLPIQFNIAWYEQKAVIVLLALMHLGFKNIKVGPTLPAFATPALVDFLVANYGLSTIGTLEADLQAIG